MKMRVAVWARIACAALLCLCSGIVAAADGDSGRSHVLVIGRISDDPASHYAQLKALLDYVVPRMGDVGIREGQVLMARDAQQMASYLRRGRVDWVTETPGTALQLQDRAGATCMLLAERNGVQAYRSVFFVRKDSPVRSLGDLRGRTLALQRIASTSAYLVPAAELLGNGMRLEVLASHDDVPSPDTVGYLLARSELNIASWVHKGLADAGALSDLDWNNPNRVPVAFRRDFRIIHETAPYPRALELARGTLDPKVEARLREVLLQASDDPQARPALREFFGTTRFLAIDPATRQSLDRLRHGIARVRLEVE